MSQLALLPELRPKAPPVVVRGDVMPSTFKLRNYQQECADAIDEAHASGLRSVLSIVPTGGGKTEIFVDLTKRRKGRTLILAPLKKLVKQARNKAEERLSERVDIDMAGWWAGNSRIVCASINTISRPDRLKRFNPGDFELIIVDEAHLSYGEGEMYDRVFKHFPEAKIAGFTATHKRADKKHHSRVYQKIAYSIGIDELISLGALCPYRIARFRVKSINLDKVHTVAGDLNEKEYSEILSAEGPLHEVATILLEQTGTRKTIVFSGPTVAVAEKLLEIVLRYRPGCMRLVHGKTEEKLREHTEREFEAGAFQYLLNVGVYTLGYDCPSIECVAFARETKSLMLYMQCAGRGLRPSPGKLDCLMLDIVGNSKRHKLISAVDLDDSGVSDEVKKRAKNLTEKKPGILAKDALAEAKKEFDAFEARQIAKRSKVKAKVDYDVEMIDPVRDLGVDPKVLKHDGRIADKAQREVLHRHGFVEPPQGWKWDVAVRLIKELRMRQEKGFASAKLVKSLRRMHIDAMHMPRGTAGALMGALRANKDSGYGWKFRPGEKESIMGTVQEPGYDG